MPPGGEEPPGGATVEDREVEREHRGVRRADRAGGHPVGDVAVRSPPGVGSEHRVERRGTVRERMDAAVQVPDPAARLVLPAGPAGASGRQDARNPPVPRCRVPTGVPPPLPAPPRSPPPPPRGLSPPVWPARAPGYRRARPPAPRCTRAPPRHRRYPAARAGRVRDGSAASGGCPLVRRAPPPHRHRRAAPRPAHDTPQRPAASFPRSPQEHTSARCGSASGPKTCSPTSAPRSVRNH